jgi:hypothetical protein
VIGNTIEISPHAKWQEHVPDKTHPSAPSYGAIESSPPDSPESPKWSSELDWVFVSFVFLVFGSQVRCSFVWVLAWAECGVVELFGLVSNTGVQLH